MVEQMVSSNLSKYGLGKSASILSSSDKPLENSPPQKETTHTEAFIQAKSPRGSSNSNRNLVYARRKSEAELSNLRTPDKNQTSGYQQSLQLGDNKHGLQTELKIKSSDGVQAREPTPIRTCESKQSSMVSSPAMEHWNLRFLQLQKYLNQSDSSNHEVYVRKLRSFSPEECSRHAVELERRAIQLMLEEGREIERVKELNVLGKSAGNYPLRPLTPIFKSEKF